MYNTYMRKNVVIVLILGLIFLSGAYSCPVYRTVGIPCPSCGMTRAYRLFFGGHFREAFAMHPLFWMPPLFLLKPFQKKRYVIGASALLILVYIARMAMMFPNTEPMLYNHNSFLGGLL